MCDVEAEHPCNQNVVYGHCLGRPRVLVLVNQRKIVGFVLLIMVQVAHQGTPGVSNDVKAEM